MEPIPEVLKHVRLRATKQRIIVLQAFVSGKALNIEEIREKLDRTDMDTATIYRTVSAFERAWIFHCLRVDGEDRYFLCGGEDSHGHGRECEWHDDVCVSYCRNCGAVNESHRHHHAEDKDILSCREERLLVRCDGCRDKS